MPASRKRRPAAAFIATATATAIATALAMPPSTSAGPLPPPIVRVAGGSLVGSATAGGVRVFKGVPYAVAGRWRPPVDAPAWSGRRDATRFGAKCPQPAFPPASVYADAIGVTSEDCLSLNIWAPAAAKRAPVMVWLHGGALLRGSAASPQYDGTALARRGVIVVEINYRLGVLGFLAHPALDRESTHGVSGNYGLLDQVEALRWVARNAAALGGDPGNVTLFGESAGALCVNLLMVSPLARGLFGKAIVQSGYSASLPELRTFAHGMVPAEAAGRRLADAVGGSDIGALRAMPADALVAVAARAGFVPTPTIDGWVLPRQIVDAFDRGEQAKVPLIAGFNTGEIRSQRSLLPSPPADATAYRAAVEARYGDLAARFLSLYPADTIDESMLAALRDAMFGWSADRMVRLQTAAGQPAYLYAFDHGYPAMDDRHLHAFHASELPYVFGTIALALPPNWPVPPDDARERGLSAAMMSYWTNFARPGVPTASGSPAWPPYGPAAAALRFTDAARVATRVSSDAFLLQEQVVGRRRRAGTQPWGPNGGIGAPPLPPPAAR